MLAAAMTQGDTLATSKPPHQRKSNVRPQSAARESARQVGLAEKINLGVASIAAASALIGAGLGVGGTVYGARLSASSAKSARAEDALRAACDQNLRVQGQSRDLLEQATAFLGSGDMDGFKKRLDDFNKVGTNGEANTLFAAAPNKDLSEAVDQYVASSDAVISSLIHYAALPQQVRAQGEELDSMQSALDAMRKATTQVAVQCRVQLENYK